MVTFEEIKERRLKLIVESAQRIFPRTKIIIEEMETEDNYYERSQDRWSYSETHEKERNEDYIE